MKSVSLAVLLTSVLNAQSQCPCNANYGVPSDDDGDCYHVQLTVVTTPPSLDDGECTWDPPTCTTHIKQCKFSVTILIEPRPSPEACCRDQQGTWVSTVYLNHTYCHVNKLGFLTGCIDTNYIPWSPAQDPAVLVVSRNCGDHEYYNIYEASYCGAGGAPKTTLLMHFAISCRDCVE